MHYNPSSSQIRTFRGKTESLYSKLQTAFSPSGMFEVDPFVKKKWSTVDGTLTVDFALVSKRHIRATVTTADGQAKPYFLYEVETSYDTR